MSPEYNVYAKPEVAEQFEKMAGDLGVILSNKKTSQKDIEDMTIIIWDQQRTRAYLLVEEFKHPNSPEALSIINKGVVKLINKLYPMKDESGKEIKRRKIGPEIDWGMAKQVLIGIFEANLPETLPSNIVLLPDMYTLTQKSSPQGSTGITPRNLEALIRVYSLHGIKQSRAEIARELGRSSVSFSLNMTERRLIRNRELSALFFKQAIPKCEIRNLDMEIIYSIS